MTGRAGERPIYQVLDQLATTDVQAIQEWDKSCSCLRTPEPSLAAGSARGPRAVLEDVWQPDACCYQPDLHASEVSALRQLHSLHLPLTACCLGVSEEPALWQSTCLR